MSDGMVQATERILLGIEALIGNQPKTTLTAALRAKIGIMVCSEPFNLSPAVLQRFLSELTAKKPDICAQVGLDTIVNRLHDRLFDGAAPKAQI
ncbi:hypothetical protein M407DRAFT_244052 [Tulasnella calospora MUT 4182]|uniref:Uncharacterized protein n=1 Tax=Tulasnella calospora MUT 4182 TaxID=1051891 RepID=A0A0C3LVW8_9AGAM|nr:hypothetical protein M407DRAFT_244052 [Tulasnella calospora MUT 4182]